DGDDDEQFDEREAPMGTTREDHAPHTPTEIEPKVLSRPRDCLLNLIYMSADRTSFANRAIEMDDRATTSQRSIPAQRELPGHFWPPVFLLARAAVITCGAL